MNDESNRMPEILTRELGLLQSSNRTLYLATLADELALGGRAHYQSDTISTATSSAQLACMNELELVVTKQLRSDLGPGTTAYPDSAFLNVLKEKAAVRGCEQWLAVALRRAMDRVDRTMGPAATKLTSARPTSRRSTLPRC